MSIKIIAVCCGLAVMAAIVYLEASILADYDLEKKWNDIFRKGGRDD